MGRHDEQEAALSPVSRNGSDEQKEMRACGRKGGVSEPQKPQTSRDRESMMQEELVGRCRASMSCERECTRNRESMSVKCEFGQAIANGNPGKPPPVPTSRNLASLIVLDSSPHLLHSFNVRRARRSDFLPETGNPFPRSNSFSRGTV